MKNTAVRVDNLKDMINVLFILQFTGYTWQGTKDHPLDFNPMTKFNQKRSIIVVYPDHTIMQDSCASESDYNFLDVKEFIKEIENIKL